MAAPPTWEELSADPRFSALTPGEQMGVLDTWSGDVKTHLGEAYDETAATPYIESQRHAIAARGQSGFSTGLRSLGTNIVQSFTKIPESLGRFNQDLAQGVDQITGKPFGISAEAIANANPWMQFLPPVVEVGTEAQRIYAPDAELNPIAATIGSGVGQVPLMIGSTVLAGPAAPLVLGAVRGYGEGSQTAEDVGVTNPFGRMALGAGFGAVEAASEKLFGIGSGPIKQTAEDLLNRVSTKFVRTALGEGAEEIPAGIGQDALTLAAAKSTEDPNRPGFTSTGVDMASLYPDSAAYWNKRKLELIGGIAAGSVFAGAAKLATRSPRNTENGTLENLSENLGDLTAADVADLETTTTPSELAGANTPADKTAPASVAPVGSTPTTGDTSLLATAPRAADLTAAPLATPPPGPGLPGALSPGLSPPLPPTPQDGRQQNTAILPSASETGSLEQTNTETQNVQLPGLERLKTPAQSQPSATTGQAPSQPVTVDNVDDLVKSGGGIVQVSQNGRKVSYDKFALMIDGNTAEVAFVELAQSERGKGIGLAAYEQLGRELAARGITLQSSKAQYGDGRKMWLKLASKGLAKLGPRGVFSFSIPQAADPQDGRQQNTAILPSASETGSLEQTNTETQNVQLPPSNAQLSTGNKPPLAGWMAQAMQDSLALVTPQQQQQIKDLAAERLTAKEIAARLKIDRDVVQAARAALGIPSRTDGVGWAGSNDDSLDFTQWRETYLASKQAPASNKDSLSVDAEDPASIANIGIRAAVGAGAARSRPVIPDSPLGAPDLLDFLNDNPIGGPSELELSNENWEAQTQIPKALRKFITDPKSRRAPEQVAQEAFDNNLIDAPTPDALIAKINEVAAARESAAAMAKGQQQGAQVNERQAKAFETSQRKLAANGRNAAVVPVDDLRPGQTLSIGGTAVTVKRTQMDEDGRNTQVTLDGGAEFGEIVLNNEGNLILADQAPVSSSPSTTPSSTTPSSEDDLPFSPTRAQQLERRVVKPEMEGLGLPTEPGSYQNGATLVKRALMIIVGNKSAPETLRMMAKVLLAADLKNLFLRIEGDGRKQYAGQYQAFGDARNQVTAQGEISINTRGHAAGQTVAETLVHEVLHHATYRALRNPRNSTQTKAIAALESLRTSLQGRPGFSEWAYPLSNIDEFISNLFTLPGFQSWLAQQPAPAGLSSKIKNALAAIFNSLAKLVTGKDVVPGSALDVAFQESLSLVETETSLSSSLSSSSSLASPTRSSVTPAQDAAYLAAVEAGDLATAQRMVDEAARAAGYNVGPLIHRGADWNALSFDIIDEGQQLGLHLGTPSQVSNISKSYLGVNRKDRPFYVSTGRQLRLEDIGVWNWETVAPQLKKLGIKISEEIDDQAISRENKGGKDNNRWVNQAIRDIISDAGFDSVVYLNRTEGVNHTAMERDARLPRSGKSRKHYTDDLLKDYGAEDSLIVLDPSQIKSADPITRDESGAVIPLSERFNPQSDSILYSPTRPPAPEGFDYTRARWAAPSLDEQLYPIAGNEDMRAIARDWHLERSIEQAIDELERQTTGLEPAAVEMARGFAIRRAALLADSKGELQQALGAALLHRAGKLRNEQRRAAAQDLQAGIMTNRELVPFAPILAANEALIDRADAVMNTRFEGGAAGGAAAVQAVATTAGEQASTNLAEQLDEETAVPVPPPTPEMQAQLTKLQQQLTDQRTTNSLFQEMLNDLRTATRNAAALVVANLKERAKQMVRQARALAKARADGNTPQQSPTGGQAQPAAVTAANAIDPDLARAVAFLTLTESLDFGLFQQVMLAEFGPSVASQMDSLYRQGAQLMRDNVKSSLETVKKREKATEKPKPAPKPTQANEPPSAATLLRKLKAKILPGTKWADIFAQLPSDQKKRQRAMYERILKDQRLAGLSQAERLELTNALDRAWQQERRKVFQAELRKVGLLKATDRKDQERVLAAMPKLLRWINLGMMDAAAFRAAIAPEYGLRTMSAADAAKLRGMAEAAYQLPEGVLRGRKLAEMLASMQKVTGLSRSEILNSYWTASVLSGLRTQFVIGMAALNGLADIGILSGYLAVTGKPGVALQALGAWGRGFSEALLDCWQIIGKGDYSIQKRFNQDLLTALDPEGQKKAGWRPVPLGETLWRNGPVWAKAPAAVMMFTGRLMAALDHITNTSTTEGAKVVARAMHPELYATAAPTAAERASARQQALAEVTGGLPTANSSEAATVRARTREILAGVMDKTTYDEASFIGDQSAMQNRPAGIMGAIHDKASAMFGGWESELAKLSRDPQVWPSARALTALLGALVRPLSGTQFLRAGFNVGNQFLSYMPGTAVVSLVRQAAFAKSESAFNDPFSKSQNALLIGRNVIGFTVATVLAAAFAGKDDEDEGWHLEGNWANLTKEQKALRRAAGFEPGTMWRRKNGKIERYTYRDNPMAGILTSVGSAADMRRSNPEKYAQRGMIEHILRGYAAGLLQVKDAQAIGTLMETLGASPYARDPEDDFIKTLIKLPRNFAGGLIPTLIKDVEIWTDPRLYKPEGIFEEMLAQVPVLRTQVGGGLPALDRLGNEVDLNRAPWSRFVSSTQDNTARRTLASLMAQGLDIPSVSMKKLIFRDGANVPIESLGPKAVHQYVKGVGKRWSEYLASPDGQALLTQPKGDAQEMIKQRDDVFKIQATMDVK